MKLADPCVAIQIAAIQEELELEKSSEWEYNWEAEASELLELELKGYRRVQERLS